MTKYDFVHFFLMDSFIFNKSIQNLIKHNDKTDRHFFVFKTSQDKDCFVDEEIKYVKSIKKYLKISKYIVIHGLKYSPNQILRIKDDYANRLIWCVWGSDLYPSPKYESYGRYYSIIKTFLNFCSGKTIIEHFVNKKIQKFRAIFYGFPGDRQFIINRFGDSIDLFEALYPIGIFTNEINNCFLNNSASMSNTPYKILIGHSGYSFLKHKKWLNILDEYDGLELHLPLSYGDQKYIETLKSMCKDNTIIQTNIMPTSQYISYLNNIDWAIFDFNHQAAFGNMILLFYLKKRLYLPQNSVMYKTFHGMGLKVFPLENLLNDLKKNSIIDLNINHEYAKTLIDKSNIVNQWNNAFKSILNHDTQRK